VQRSVRAAERLYGNVARIDGAWRGLVSTTTTQSDSAVSGTGTISGASVAHVTVSGMSDRPTLNLTLADTAGELIFSGTYVTAGQRGLVRSTTGQAS